MLEEERRRQNVEYRTPQLDPVREKYRSKNTFDRLAKQSASGDVSPAAQMELHAHIADHASPSATTPVKDASPNSELEQAELTGLDRAPLGTGEHKNEEVEGGEGFDRHYFATAREIHRDDPQDDIVADPRARTTIPSVLER